jgi:hypothetical protein
MKTKNTPNNNNNNNNNNARSKSCPLASNVIQQRNGAAGVGRRRLQSARITPQGASTHE